MLSPATVTSVDIGFDIPGMETWSFGIRVAMDEFDQLDGHVATELIVDKEVYAVSGRDVWTVRVAAQWQAAHER